jgi:hypothetical protein
MGSPQFGEPIFFCAGKYLGIAERAEDYFSDLVIARKMRSSTATERVKRVAAWPFNARPWPAAPNAGPARFSSELFVELPVALVDLPSPGCTETRKVFGVQELTPEAAAPKQVSRMNTWR